MRSNTICIQHCMKESLFTMDIIIFITEIQCNIASLPTLSNGEDAEVLSEEYRGTAVYRCTDGYEVIGYPSVYCNETAQWSQLEATCEGLSRIVYSSMQYDPSTGAKVKLLCKNTS